MAHLGGGLLKDQKPPPGDPALSRAHPPKGAVGPEATSHPGSISLHSAEGMSTQNAELARAAAVSQGNQEIGLADSLGMMAVTGAAQATRTLRIVGAVTLSRL
jgi:hypothetical protein